MKNRFYLISNMMLIFFLLQNNLVWAQTSSFTKKLDGTWYCVSKQSTSENKFIPTDTKNSNYYFSIQLITSNGTYNSNQFGKSGHFKLNINSLNFISDKLQITTNFSCVNVNNPNLLILIYNEVITGTTWTCYMIKQPSKKMQ